MNFKKVILPLMLSLSFLVVACEDATQAPDNEDAESQIQDAGEDTGNALEDAGEDAGNALEDAEDATEEGINDAGSAIEEAGDSVKDATD